MPDPIADSPTLKKIVEFKGAELTPEDIDSFNKYQEGENRTKKIEAVLDAWETQEDASRTARKKYADIIIWVLVIQGILVNIAFFLIGFGLMAVEEWVANSFILGVFAEISGLSFVVIKYFFPPSPSQIAGLVDKL